MGLTLFQRNKAGLLGQQSPGMYAGAHSATLGHLGMRGMVLLVALISLMSVARANHSLMMLMGPCSLSAMAIRRLYVIV